MKKTPLLTYAAAAGLLVVSSQAKDVRSPDGRYAIRAEQTISLIDVTGEEIFVLARDTSDDLKVEVAWSPDSRHVVVVENYRRGSVITGAWKDEAWHKTLQVDHAPIANGDGKLIAEHRQLAGWITPSEVAVKGDMTFSGGAHHHYGYTLAFRQVPGHLDRGGYEEGQLIGKDYHSL
jgi:hypothetical protein